MKFKLLIIGVLVSGVVVAILVGYAYLAFFPHDYTTTLTAPPPQVPGFVAHGGQQAT